MSKRSKKKEKRSKKVLQRKKKGCNICTRCHGKNVKFFNKAVKTICVGTESEGEKKENLSNQ